MDTPLSHAKLSRRKSMLSVVNGMRNAAALQVGGVPRRVSRGMLAGTRVATTVGLQRVESLRPGDEVLTMDNGFRNLRHVCTDRLSGFRAEADTGQALISIPALAIGNREPFHVLSGQTLHVETEVARQATGDRGVYLRADSLVGICEIYRFFPVEDTKVVSFHFDQPEVIFTSSGALCICNIRNQDEFGMAASNRSVALQGKLLDPGRNAELIREIRSELNTGWLLRQNGPCR